MTKRRIASVVALTSVSLALAGASTSCQGGNDGAVSDTSVGGGKPSRSGSSSSGASFTEGGPGPGEAGPGPVVQCTTVDGGEDDAGDAALQTETEAGSPCETPPPSECLSSQTAVEYSAGVCSNGTCKFASKFILCPGGCFRGLDGGDNCNE